MPCGRHGLILGPLSFVAVNAVAVMVCARHGKGRALDIAPQVDTATAEALRYMARIKQRRTYLPYTFPATAGTYLPTPRGFRVE